jgi:hypothetical protein
MPEPTETIAVVEPNLLADFLTDTQIKAAFDWGDRTLRRREADGLPVIVLGATRLYPREKVMAWLHARVREPEIPRRGRPRKAASYA